MNLPLQMRPPPANSSDILSRSYLSHLPNTLFTPLPMTATVNVLREFLSSRSVRGYLVGGYLRDALLGSASKDVDVAVEGDALALGRELVDLLHGSFVALNPARGIARVVPPRGQSLVDLSSFQGSIELDLARRDFTIDAMALPLEKADTPHWPNDVIDPFDGRRDLACGLIRMVADGVFIEDPSRLLRAARLARSLGFDVEMGTAALIARNAGLLSWVSAERVRDEFLAILSLKGAKESLHCLDDLGLLCPIIPELEDTRGVEQPKEHYWDAFEHIIQTVGAVDKVTAGLGQDPLSATIRWDQALEAHFAEVVSDGHNRRTLLKLGALVHDIAKPQTKAVDQTGRTRFLGHPTLGASMAQERLRSLRLSARGVKSVCVMVEHHLRPTQMSQGVETPTPRAIHRFFRDLGDTAVSVLYLSLADYLAARGPMLEVEDWQRHVALVNHILEGEGREPARAKKPRLITGHDLIESFGLEPGPLFRRLLEGLEEAQATQEVQTRDEALAWVKVRLDRERG